MHPMLNTAVKAARQAGRLINRASLDIETMQVTRKDRNDFVTEVDRASEDSIVQTLLGAYPKHAILGEETGLRTASGTLPMEQAEALRTVDHLWVIDPLDGTTNFIHGVPHYAISIALVERGVLTQAVIYDPVRNELFTASRGRGAYLNDRRMRVTSRDRIDEALLGTGFPYRSAEYVSPYLKVLAPLMQRAAGIRRAGAAALDLAYVAAGRFDAFFEVGIKPWDVAAGALLVTEAGGFVGDFDGNASHTDGRQVLAAGPKIYAAMIPMLAPLRRAMAGTAENAASSRTGTIHARAAGPSEAQDDAGADAGKAREVGAAGREERLIEADDGAPASEPAPHASPAPGNGSTPGSNGN